MPRVEIPAPDELLARVRALPAAQVLLERLGDVAGVYLVGGAVRDLLRGKVTSDLDLVVEGDAAAVAARLGIPRVHDRFGTSTVVVDGFSYDLAGARRESYARPGALPDVTPAPLEADLRRRDFSVNAIAIALGGPGAGAVQAFPGALEDLEAQRLRVLHDRSFNDDPTRLLRLARYASRLGFSVEPRTRLLAETAVGEGAIGTVSGARVGTELRLLAAEPDPVAAFGELAELGLDRAVHERLRLENPELARRALEFLPSDGRRDLLILALALASVPPAELGPLLDSLSFEARDRDLIVAIVERAPELATKLAKARSAAEIAAAATSAPPEVVAVAGAMGPGATATEWLERLRHVRLAIDGEDLLRAGVPEGPAIGVGLRAALAAKLDGAAVDREDELAHALRAARGGS
jgi:tRNA nucleotidyltransferase (CCA-adding enzyme)